MAPKKLVEKERKRKATCRIFFQLRTILATNPNDSCDGRDNMYRKEGRCFQKKKKNRGFFPPNKKLASPAVCLELLASNLHLLVPIENIAFVSERDVWAEVRKLTGLSDYLWRRSWVQLARAFALRTLGTRKLAVDRQPLAVNFAVVHTLQSSVILTDVHPGNLAKLMEDHRKAGSLHPWTQLARGGQKGAALWKLATQRVCKVSCKLPSGAVRTSDGDFCFVWEVQTLLVSTRRGTNVLPQRQGEGFYIVIHYYYIETQLSCAFGQFTQGCGRYLQASKMSFCLKQKNLFQNRQRRPQLMFMSSDVPLF